MSDETWKSEVEANLGVKLDNWQMLGGGDFAQSYAVRVLPDNKPIFVKTHGSPPPNHFTTEARGLQWLSDTQSVRVPEVLGVSDDIPFLAIAWVEESRQRHAERAGEAEFGQQLAALHRYECSHFGRTDKRTTGSQGLPNEPMQTWTDFYATQRLLPLARLAAERNALNARIIDDIERLASRLGELFPADVSPSRLHGDLWAGNRLVDASGKSWVIDPACHGGHREFDLAMMQLFGGYAQACFDAYHEAYPLDEDWQARVPLHQLAPLIVHAIKFGDAYKQATSDALACYL